MPFTGSHPAAVLPLLGTPLPASALVIGSMAPDIPYYVPYVTGPTHTLVGVVTIDLLLGAAAWLGWHGVLAAPALSVAPQRIRERVVPAVHLGLARRARSVRHLILVVLALVIGSTTHVVWDAFTHPGRWGADHLPVLDTVVAGLPLWHWAQYASTVLGALAIGWWLVRWWRRAPVGAVPSVRWSGYPWVALVAIGALVGGAAALTAPSLSAAPFLAATRGASAALLAALVLALVWHVHSMRRSRT